jgi:hypothetical protein
MIEATGCTGHTRTNGRRRTANTGNRPSSRRHVPRKRIRANDLGRASVFNRRVRGELTAETGNNVHDGFGSNARAGTSATRASSRRVRLKRKPARTASRRQVREIDKRGPEVTKGRSGIVFRRLAASGRTRTRAWPANAEGDENLKRGGPTNCG